MMKAIRVFASLLVLLACMGCATHGTWARYEMCFGLSTDSGRTVLTEGQWKEFVEEEIVPRFPAGFTIFEAEGYWRGETGAIAEPAKILMVVAPDGDATRLILESLANTYIERFQQEAVLVIKSPATVVFHE